MFKVIGMATAPKNSPLELLRNFVPLNLLPEEDLYRLLENAAFEKFGKNQVLFSEGEMDNQNIYLLSGKVQLMCGGQEMDKVDSHSETARFPLAHQIPRKFTAVAPKQAEVVRLDSRLLGELVVKAGQEDHDTEKEENTDEDDWMTQLLHLRVFQQIPPANIQRVMMCMKEVRLNAGELVVKQGDEGDYFYLIHEGHCVVTRVAASSGEHEEVARLGPGDSFGEESLLSGLPRAGTVTMLSDGHLLKLGKEDFVRYVKDSVTCSVDYEQALSDVQGGGIWIDVRSPGAYEAFHLPGSISLPLISLRYQSSSLDPDRSYIVYCDDGRHSVTAAFLLLELGYQVSSLEAGLSALPSEILDGYSGSNPPSLEAVQDVEDPRSEPDIPEVRQVHEETERALPHADEQAEELAHLKLRLEEVQKALTESQAGTNDGTDTEALQEAQARLKEMEGEKEQLKSEIVENAEELVVLKNSLKERDDKLGKLTSKLSRVNMKLKEDRGGDETGLLRDELAEAVAARESAEQELKRQIRKLEEKQSEAGDFKAFEAELATLTDALEDSEKSCDEAVERAERLEKERILQDEKLHQLQSQAKDLELQFSTLSSEKEELRQELSSYQRLLDDRNKELDQLREEYHAFKVKIEAQSAEFDQMQQELNEARMEADEANFKRKEAQDSRQQVEDALYQARREVEAIKSGGKVGDDTEETFDSPVVKIAGTSRKLIVGALLGALLTFGLIDGLLIARGNGEIVTSLLGGSSQTEVDTAAKGPVKMAAKGTPVSSKGKAVTSN